VFCKEQVAQLRDYVGRIRDAGAELVVVGNGNPQQAAWFQEDTGIETPLYTDPSLKVYDAVEAKRGLLTSLNPATIVASLRARRAGFKQSKTMGAAFQQGGVFVITPGGEMPYRYVSKSAGDHPDPTEPLSALEQLARPG
jgi:peroxiredoxin